MSKLLIWDKDETTLKLAKRWHPPVGRVCTPQYSGEKHLMIAKNWESKYKCRFPSDIIMFDGKIRPNPENILFCLKQEYYIEGLLLVIRWGLMTRTIKKIMGIGIKKIQNTMKYCKEDITKIGSVEKSWKQMTRELQWTDVITSKTLHFLCRSCGFVINPPVPLDNKVTLKRLLPAFREGSCIGRGYKWRSDDYDFENYKKYMTAILTWKDRLNYSSSTNLEADIFGYYNTNGK